ncbi:MAG: Aconitate hydratase A [Alphaproteobacteria bacterium MarineAlpha6_Bin6]|nr:aconitate hydratase AcnA [Pelagibacteraceae bacterium]PPR30410.1 MAG: Aconitate hydratase A [Alphaproteobacteria bacterium MarineAlpha6_Bin6]PPR33906.1 MAG: Aconitate hydratase A [Alphaproteobacteria bacterium MarineAlpha6_Bin5]|tara:strand:+ start:10336 stop:12921 length:2586 start_codon:yes stop_codon:yes gene_type:complete
MNLNIKKKFKLNNKVYNYYSLKDFEKKNGIKIKNLPFTIKILLENLLRNQNNSENIKQIKNLINNTISSEIFFNPSRILMQDFTGIPAIADLAAMRDKMYKMGKNTKKINPLVPVDLVIDHSINVNFYGSKNALNLNVKREFKENSERYNFLKWSQASFKNFKVIPPGNGICHQVNLEYLAKVVSTKLINKDLYIYPDTLVGTDSHTTMINSLGVLGWGVGGIEAEAAMLNQPIPINVPNVIGVNLKKKLKEGVTATDLVLSLTNLLRKKNVVGKFIEFFGEGVKNLSLPDRATISNMAPEYGATCGFFPVDNVTIDYLKLTARNNEHINLVKKYLKLQNLFREKDDNKIKYNKIINFELDKIESAVAGPKRPQDLIKLSKITDNFKNNYNLKKTNNSKLDNGSVVIAAITSCTNTSNPTLMVAAALLAKNALKLGLKVKPWVKTSLAPGSKVVTDYLKKANLQKYLDYLGFNLVGYGCTTCIGNSGPLENKFEKKIIKNNLTVCSVLSGNRNFEGRINSLVKANYLASPPLVVAFAIFGNININFYKEPLGIDKKNNKVFLKDIWPNQKEINLILDKILSPRIFKKRYSTIFKGENYWNKKSKLVKSDLYNWSKKSTYIKKPPFFENINNEKRKINNILNARLIALLGDSITTDHISPAGRIKSDSLASKYLQKKNVKIFDFNTYGSRRGNHEIMMRGVFSNMDIPSVYQLSQKYKKINVPSIIIAGKEYGTGSSRDWAAKGVSLLGVKAVIFETIERIHRTNLIGMGILPLQFLGKDNAKNLKIKGDEVFDFVDLDNDLKPNKIIKCYINYKNGQKKIIKLKLRIDSKKELEYLSNGGILPYVLKQICNEENTQNYDNI